MLDAGALSRPRMPALAIQVCWGLVPGSLHSVGTWKAKSQVVECILAAGASELSSETTNTGQHRTGAISYFAARPPPCSKTHLSYHQPQDACRSTWSTMTRSHADSEGDGPSSAPPPPALAPEVSLGNNIFLIEPAGNGNASSTSPNDGNGPSLIILCTWLGGATTRRIAKYVEGYRTSFPDATLILIRTVLADITARSFDSLRSRLQPARDAILRALQSPLSPAPAPNVLLHVFSHGGCNTAIQLAQSLSDVDADAGELFRDRLWLFVFDCCPGDTSFDKAFRAAAVSLPPTISSGPLPIRALGTAAVFTLIAAVTALQRVGLMASVSDMRRDLNDPALFGRRARRLYLFSRADTMVDPADVRSHARLAREEAGCEVGLVAFRDAAHCTLLTEDAPKYWRAIRDCWQGEPLPQLDGAKL